MSILKVWQLTLILAKQDPMGRGYTEKKAFLHSSDEKTWFLTFPLIFKWSKMRGFKKASLYIHYKGLTTDSYFDKARLPGERSYRKMGFFTLFWWENMISDLSIPFIFDHLKINGKVRNHVFSSEKCKKAFFSVWPLPRGSCFAKIRVSCQTFKIDIERSFLTPHFWPFENQWKGQKSCFLIRRV